MLICNGKLADIEDVAAVIRQSFADVARRFQLTLENCPKHPSHYTAEWVKADMDRGVKYFLMVSNSAIIGCVGLERVDRSTCYMERLAVVPGMRRQGLGTALFNHFLNRAAALGCEKISIGIIAKQDELRQWYEKMGFVETGRNTFAHLPFEVAFLTYKIKDHDIREIDSGQIEVID